MGAWAYLVNLCAMSVKIKDLGYYKYLISAIVPTTGFCMLK
jgi:hypothetical protein